MCWRCDGSGCRIVEIGEATGYHPATISKWCRDGGPPPARQVAVEERVVDAVWADRLTRCWSATRGCWRRRCSRSSAPRGSTARIRRWPAGCVSSVVHGSGGLTRRRCRSRLPRVRKPSSISRTARRGRSGSGSVPVLWCFGMILCWSRWRMWWFTTSVDREHTFEGMARFFDAAGGVPQLCRTDRMGALGQSQGRRFKLHPPTLEFARSSRHRDQGVPGRRRETQRQGRAPVP